MKTPTKEETPFLRKFWNSVAFDFFREIEENLEIAKKALKKLPDSNFSRETDENLRNATSEKVL